MEDRDKDDLRHELGRMPVGHFPMYGAMPKPDADRAAEFNWPRMLALFVLALVIAAALLLVLPDVIWPH